jgi:hypothetical protein
MSALLTFSLRCAILLLLASTLAWSLPRQPLAPSAYEELQKNATEVVQIEVLKVEVEPGEELREEVLRITAAVLDVERSASGVRTGDFIQISYSVQSGDNGQPLPAEVPILKEGQRTIAFLQTEEGRAFLVPAAGAMSFSRF